MNIADMLALIALKCGNREIEEMEEYAVPYLRIKQAELEADPFLPWFLRREGNVSITEGLAELPEDFLKFAPNSGLWYTSGAGDISEVCLAEAQLGIRKYGVQVGIPMLVALGNTELNFFPAPDSGLCFFEYFGKEPELGLDAPLAQSNAWTEHAPWYLLSAVGLEVAQDLEHAPGVQFFAQKLEAAREMLFRQDAERAISGQALRW